MEKIRLKLKAYDHRVLDRSVAAIVEAVKRTGAEIVGPIPMPTKIKRYTVLRSPHVNKSSREQFEMRIHSRMIDIVSATTDQTVRILLVILDDVSKCSLVGIKIEKMLDVRVLFIKSQKFFKIKRIEC